MDQSLEKRAGKNVGVVTALYPRISHGRTKLVDLPKGPSDTVVWTCPDDIETLMVAGFDFFNKAAAPSPLALEIILRSPNGVEHPAIPVNVPAAVAGVTGFLVVSPFDVPLTLTPGEQIIIRITDPTYLGGCVVNAAVGQIYGGYSVRQLLGTVPTVVVEPPPGKALGAINAGVNYASNLMQPIWLANSDSIDHHVTVVVEENGVDTTVIENWLAPLNGLTPIPYNSVHSGQKIKMSIQEPIVTPGKSVLAAVFYMLVDEGGELV